MAEIKSGRKASDVKLFIAILALDSKIFCSTVTSLLDAFTTTVNAGIIHFPRVMFLMQDGNIPFARNRAVAQFMQTDCTDLIFIDSDISWDRESFMRLICHPVDVVGATYRKKIQDLETGALVEQYAIDNLSDENDMVKGSDPETGLLEVNGLPTGFLRITRNAIQKMINECDVQEYEIDEHGKPLTLHRLFSFDYVKERGEVSEDYRFCHRWREIGGKVWLDPWASVDHMGVVKFQGNFGKRLMGAIEEAKMLEAAE